MVSGAPGHLESEYATALVTAKAEAGRIPQPTDGAPRVRSLIQARFRGDREEVFAGGSIHHDVGRPGFLDQASPMFKSAEPHSLHLEIAERRNP